MNREQLRNELPEPVRRYFEEVARMEPPVDLLNAAITQVESEPRVNRFSLLPAFVAVAATALIAAVIAFNVFGLKLGPPTGTDTSPTPEASATVPPVQTPPPLDGLPSAGAVEGRYAVGNAGAPVLAAHGSIWLTNGGTGVVTRVDPDTGEITAQIDVNPNPETDRYDQNLVADDTFVWATGADQTLVKIDPGTNTVLERIDIGRIVYRMQAHGDAIWATDLDSTNSVIRVDTATGEVAFRLPMSDWPGGLAVTNDAVWVTPYQDSRLVRLDPVSGAFVEEFTVDSFGMAIVPDGDALYISGNQGRPLERFSISEGRVTARFGTEIGVVLLDGRLYAIYQSSLITLDPETLQVTAAANIGPGAGNMLPADGFLWVTQGSDLLKIRPAQ
jgi:glutamine cyclotransferase